MAEQIGIRPEIHLRGGNVLEDRSTGVRMVVLGDRLVNGAVLLKTPSTVIRRPFGNVKRDLESGKLILFVKQQIAAAADPAPSDQVLSAE